MAPKSVTNIGERAATDLAFIRSTLSSNSTFTSVSGVAILTIGVIGVLAAWIATSEPDFDRWLILWLFVAALCAVIGGGAMYRKDRRNMRTRNVSLNVRFFMTLLPSFFAAALLTWAYRQWLPAEQLTCLRGYLVGIWLLLYGAGVFTAGLISIKPVSLMGLAIIFAGAIGLLTKSQAVIFPELMMAGFGLVHIVFGILIWKHHGG